MKVKGSRDDEGHELGTSKRDPWIWTTERMGLKLALRFLVWVTGGTVMPLNENENVLGHWELSLIPSSTQQITNFCQVFACNLPHSSKYSSH